MPNQDGSTDAVNEIPRGARRGFDPEETALGDVRAPVRHIRRAGKASAAPLTEAASPTATDNIPGRGKQRFIQNPAQRLPGIVAGTPDSDRGTSVLFGKGLIQ